MFGGDPPIYHGGFARLLRSLDKRRVAFLDAGAHLPPRDVDLAALHRKRVPVPEADIGELQRNDATAKWLELSHEFQGQSQLFLLHAALIAYARRKEMPATTLPLFFRIWSEQGRILGRDLPVRWLISAATTFADHGQNGDQRALGMGLSLLFDLIKLHESERRSTGVPGDTLAPTVPPHARPDIAFGMAPYSLKNGDLDKVMLARLWDLSERDAVIRPLAVRMLNMVMTDRRTVFARIRAARPPKDMR